MRLTNLPPDIRLSCDMTASRSDWRSKQRVNHPIYAPFIGRVISVEVMPPGRLSRKVVKRSNARSTGYMPSLKLGRLVAYESPYELMLARMFDIDPEAGLFRPQPAVIEYELNGARGRHYPDFLQDAKKQVFWEVKTFADAMSPEIHARSALMVRDLPAFGFEYRHAYAEDLFAEPRRSNVLRLITFSRDAPEYCVESMLQHARSLGTISWRELREGAALPLTASILCAMVMDGSIAFCLDGKWTDDSQFFTANG